MGKNARKKARRLAAVQSVSNATSVGKRGLVERAVDGTLGGVFEDDKVYLFSGDKNRARDGFDRRFQSRKTKKRDFCRTLDFAANPVTGQSNVPVNSRFLETNNFYQECHKREHAEELVYLTKLLATKLANKPKHVTKRYVRDENGVRQLIHVDTLADLNSWECEVKALRARIQDHPLVTILSKPQTITESTIDGKFVEQFRVPVMEPNKHPANGRMLRPAFNKVEPSVIAEAAKMKSITSIPMMKMANSHRREIPLALALWMICKQEGLDPVKEYGIDDDSAQTMLDKLHERN